MAKIKQLFSLDETESELPVGAGESIFTQLRDSLSEGVGSVFDKTISTVKDTVKETGQIMVETSKDTFSAWGSVDLKKDKEPKNQFGQINRQTLIQSQIVNAQMTRKRAMEDVARLEVAGMSQIDKNKRLGLNLDYASENTEDTYHANLLKDDVIEDLEKQERNEKVTKIQQFQASGQINLNMSIEGGSQKGMANISTTGGGGAG